MNEQFNTNKYTHSKVQSHGFRNSLNIEHIIRQTFVIAALTSGKAALTCGISPSNNFTQSAPAPLQPTPTPPSCFLFVP